MCIENVAIKFRNIEFGSLIIHLLVCPCSWKFTGPALPTE